MKGVTRLAVFVSGVWLAGVFVVMSGDPALIFVAGVLPVLFLGGIKWVIAGFLRG